MSNARSLPESRAPFTSDLHFKNVNQFTSENAIFTIFTTVKDKAVNILQKVIKAVDLYFSNVHLFSFTVVNIQGGRKNDFRRLNRKMSLSFLLIISLLTRPLKTFQQIHSQSFVYSIMSK
jgi:hypothetical protein